MQMGTGGEAGHAHIADDIALLHMRADADVPGEARHMTVQRGYAVAVGEHHGIAVAAALTREADASIAGGVHGRAGGRGVVGAHVPADEVQDGMLRCGLNTELTRVNSTGARRKALRIGNPSGV
jgi:hypothetical protein